MTRCYFPALPFDILHPFLSITQSQDQNIPHPLSMHTLDGVTHFPFQSVYRLATGTAVLPKTFPLLRLAQFKIAKNKQATPPPTGTTRCLFVSDPQSSFAREYFLCPEKEIPDTFPTGESFLITLFSEDLKHKEVIAGIHFRRTEYGVLINYLKTSDSHQNPNLPVTPFRRMGLSTFLLRAVQLYQCCHGHPPFLYVHADKNSEFGTYLHRRGFKPLLPTSPAHQAFKYRFGIWSDLFSSSIITLMHLDMIAKYRTQEDDWKRPPHLPQLVVDCHERGTDCVLFHQPFYTDGRYIDQCAKGLRHLGSPFFYFRLQQAIAPQKNHTTIFPTLVDKAKLLTLRLSDKRDSTTWLTQEHLQVLVNWIFRDERNPLLRQFHVVPLGISSLIHDLFNRSKDSPVGSIAHALDAYAKTCWRLLNSKMIFYVQNLNQNHWVLHVAVNPAAMMAQLTPCETATALQGNLYGYLYIDPMELQYRNGTAPSGSLSDHNPIANAPLVFLLNFLSRYRDAQINGSPQVDPKLMHSHHLWAMGGFGPFGRVFLSSNELEQHKTIRQHLPHAVFPHLKAHLNTFPFQTDQYNCGVLAILSILDIVLSQWDKKWVTEDLEIDPNNVTPPVGRIAVGNNEPISFLIPKAYGLGTSFISKPEEATGEEYTELCDLIRLEFEVLLERLYVIYHQAFSDLDEDVDSNQWGSIPKRYLSRIAQYRAKDHVLQKLFTEISWPTHNDVRALEHRDNDFTKFVQRGPSILPTISINDNDYSKLLDSNCDLSLWYKVAPRKKDPRAESRMVTDIKEWFKKRIQGTEQKKKTNISQHPPQRWRQRQPFMRGRYPPQDSLQNEERS